MNAAPKPRKRNAKPSACRVDGRLMPLEAAASLPCIGTYRGAQYNVCSADPSS